MATLSPGTPVEFREGEAEKLRFRPPGGQAYVAVHGVALRAPQNQLTLVVFMHERQVTWVGAVDERMVQATGPPGADPRPILRQYIDQEPSGWRVVAPGLLTETGVPTPYLTIYDGERPWVVVGELPTGASIAAPLNDARGNPKWWAPQVSPPALKIPGAKPSQIELAHLWALDSPGSPLGSIDASDDLKEAVLGYVR